VTRRRAIGIGILVLWAGVVGFHISREYFRSEALILAHGARSLGPGSYFYTVQHEGRAIGVASSRLDTIPEGFRVEDLLQLDVPAMGAFHSAVVRTEARLGPALEVLAFDFRLRSAVGDYRVRGEMRGDSTLAVSVDAGSGAEAANLRLRPTTTLAVALPLRLAAAGRLVPGGEYTARVLDPSVLADRPVSVRVTGRDRVVVGDSVAFDARMDRWRIVSYDTVSTWVVEESYGGIRVTSWLDQDGRIVRSESPLGFSLRRVPYEIADQAWRWTRSDAGPAAGYGALIESTAIAANVDVSGAARRGDGLAVRLLNVELDGFDLDGGRQRLRGDTLVVTGEGPSAWAAAYALPYRGGGDPAAHLVATPLIQTEDPRIVETARRVAGGSDSPAVVAERLNEWVHGALRKEITPSIPSAVQVLESRQGDCNEHTVLYVALARAAGLPAREAVGLVHLDGRFYYHAWPEVWLGEWVAVDPTLGQFPAGPTHLRFLVGGLDRQVELIRLVGRLDLEILAGQP
jgi:transglutaminase-like putative cysteine protease